MPVKVLEELERIEIAITDKERRAFVFQADAQDLRIRHNEIIALWKARAAWEGLDNLVAERQHTRWFWCASQDRKYFLTFACIPV